MFEKEARYERCYRSFKNCMENILIKFDGSVMSSVSITPITEEMVYEAYFEGHKDGFSRGCKC